MSRICVKNLPKHVAEDRMRDFFSRKGEVTDAKLIRTKDGISRQFGFVGFRTEKEAQEALKFFNNSFMDTCKITCEIARKVGDPDMPRPWSRHSLKKQQNSPEEKKQVKGPKGSHIENSEEEKNKVKGTKSSRHVHSQEEDKDSENDDPQLQEFLEVMQPRANAKLWANDTSTVTPFEKTEKAVGKKVKVKGERKKENAVSKLDETVSGSVDGEAEKSYTSYHNEVVSDKDYFRSRVKTEWSDSENDDDDYGDDDDDTKNAEDKVNLDSHHKYINNPNKQHADNDIHKGNVFEGAGEEDENDMMKESNPKEEEEDEEEVFESGRLFVRNLPYTATEEELEEHFSRFGNVSQVHVAVDKHTKQSKGFGFVLYTLPESAARALENLDNSTFQGRLMHVMPAKVKVTPLKIETNILPDQSMTFKKKRQEERKASEASGNTRAWNTLYMRPDTVVENIARKFGVSKGELLDREADDIAVRIALGETQVIAETKKALENAGINVALLEEFAAGKVDSEKRSNHVIIVKNLPYASSEGELADLFGKYGNLDKIILPPTKALALVVFLEPVDAASAFKRLAYARYKDTPLYLEWAPADIISHNSASLTTANDSVIVGEHDSKKVYLEQQTEGMLDADIDTDRVESRSLYVKNLNFKTSDESLKKHFDKHVKEGKILSVRVKKHSKNGKNVSMGFGFIEFDSVDTANNVCRALQGTVLDQHALALQLCHAKNNETVLKKAQKDQSSTKLIVRNVAFEATKKELKQLFSPFGQIKRLKLPMRYGHHRGFAFVEYVTKQEAQNALKALSSTHLYGRHLVLERAKEGESLDELRARIASQFEHEQNGFQKLSKKRKHMDVLDDGSLKFQKIVD